MQKDLAGRINTGGKTLIHFTGATLADAASVEDLVSLSQV